MLGVNYKESDFFEAIMAANDGQGVDLILDPVGAGYFQRNINLLKRHGRLVMIGLLSGVKTDVNLAPILIKNLKIKGSTLRARPIEEKIAITTGFIDRFWPLFLNGTLKPIVDTTFPLADAQQAHAYVAANKNTGKVVLLI